LKAIALVEAPDHVCCRYRLRAFAPALRAAGIELTIEGLAHGPLARAAQLHRAGRFDVAILQRKLLPPWQFAILRRSARRLVFDFDDAVLYRDSNDRRGPHCPRRSARFAQTVRAADAVLAGNAFLADSALVAGARAASVQVIPTCIEPGRYLPKPGPPTRGLQLVWVGSSSTLRGLEQRRALWERLGRERPEIRLRLIADRFPKFDPLEVVPIAWSEATEAAEISQGDVGISWVPDGLWSRGKCGLKVLQYQAAGLPVIANPVGVHAEMIEPGVTGFLADSDADWLEAITTLDSDPGRRQAMGAAARRSVESRYAVEAWAPAVVGAIAGPGTTPTPNPHHQTPIFQ
jgi:glycosyltransferase involved in cell wall biosynthesis